MVAGRVGVTRGALRCVMVAACMTAGVARADSSALQDVTGDGQVSILTFGDSLTYGVGDGSNPGDVVEIIADSGSPRGYPLRVSAATGVAVSNAGEPGERLSPNGVARLPGLIVGSDIDTVVFMEGTNDSFFQVDAREYRLALQKAINVAKAEGKSVVLNTLPPPVANRASLAPFTSLYSSIVRELSALNRVAFADLEQRFLTDCPDLSSCQLYNIPEGLHPNTVGYDVIAEEVLVALAAEGGSDE